MSSQGFSALERSVLLKSKVLISMAYAAGVSLPDLLASMHAGYVQAKSRPEATDRDILSMHRVYCECVRIARAVYSAEPTDSWALDADPELN